MNDERLLDYKEAAAYLNISKSHLYDLVKAGELKCVRLGLGRKRCRGMRFERGYLTELKDSRINAPSRAKRPRPSSLDCAAAPAI